jgi:ABC-type lipoprotein release transport system permease subunit
MNGASRLIFQNILRNKRNFIFSSIGIVVGVSMFSFFVALGEGIREGVINRIYPINQVEIEPRAVNVLGVKENIRDTPLTQGSVEVFREVAGVVGAYPKQRSKFQARLWGGKGLFERDVHAEAFFDGIDPDLIQAELRLAEWGSADGPPPERRAKRQLPCMHDGECSPAQECKEGKCVDIAFFTLFADWGESLSCKSVKDCAPGSACLLGMCRAAACARGAACEGGGICAAARCTSDGDCGGEAGSCAAGFCAVGACARSCERTATGGVPGRSSCNPGEWCVAPPCASDADCGGARCVDGQCAGAGVCERMTCALDSHGDQLSSRPSVFRGRVSGVCADGARPNPDGKCEVPLQCPERTYCAAQSASSHIGACERPVPVVVSPFLIEMFNSAAATALGLRRISETHALLGLQFRIQYGDSFFVDDVAKERQVIKRAQVVGFSSKALDLGVTMPLPYVERANARFKGTSAAGQFDSVILETGSNEAVPAVTRSIEDMGYELSRKSQDAKKAGNMLYILTVVFALISWIILTIAAINISHTFLMMITERKKELGLLRAIGATRMDVRKLVLGEAAIIGLAGGVVGNAFAVGASAGVDALAARLLADMPFLPEEFFIFEWPALLASFAMALLFCVVGAFFPANRAARLDPAVVLSQP